MHADRRVVLSLVLSSAFHSGTAVWRLRYRPSAISRVLARRNAGVVIFHFKPTADCNWSKMHLDVGRSGRGAAGSTVLQIVVHYITHTKARYEWGSYLFI